MINDLKLVISKEKIIDGSKTRFAIFEEGGNFTLVMSIYTPWDVFDYNIPIPKQTVKTIKWLINQP